jgi:hypothetical protein
MAAGVAPQLDPLAFDGDHRWNAFFSIQFIL